MTCEVAQPSRRARLRPGHHGSQLVAVASRASPAAATDRPARIGAGYLEGSGVKVPIYEVQHPDGEWLECSKRTFDNFSGVGKRTRYVETQEIETCQSSPN